MMNSNQWRHVAKRMAEAREKMLKIESDDAARIFNCLQHFALSCADATTPGYDGPDAQP